MPFLVAEQRSPQELARLGEYLKFSEVVIGKTIRAPDPPKPHVGVDLDIRDRVEFAERIEMRGARVLRGGGQQRGVG
jgi:hypothetical protein